MGHLVGKSVYQRLQARLDLMPVGAPAQRALVDILKLLFTDDEAFIASRMPVRFATITTIQKRTGKSIQYLEKRLNQMASKGLVIDLQFEDRPTCYVLLPTVIGFFEFTMMRMRNDFDQKLLARLYDEYLLRDPQNQFLKQAFQQETQLIRTLVHEDVLPPEVFTEVLDYEKATWIIKNTPKQAVSLCHCRHVKYHLDQACEHPLRNCLTLGNCTDYLVRRGLAEPIETSEALDILAQARDLNMVQLADNVQHNVGFICNCCKCSCTILETLRRIGLNGKLTYTSNYLAVINPEKCNGCGRCAVVCSIECIAIKARADASNEKQAQVDESRCLGCGICVSNCSHAAIQMQLRPQRVFTPEGSLERILMMAVERNKLKNLLFDDLESFPINLINRLMGWILKQKSVQQFLLSENIRSKWIEFAVKYANRG